MSKYAEQIVEVMKIIKDDWWDAIPIDHYLTTDEADSIAKAAFKKCADKFNVTESTIRDKCTRQMEISTAEFLRKVKEYITNTGYNGNDEEKRKGAKRKSLDFEILVTSHAKADDDHDNIGETLRTIRDK